MADYTKSNGKKIYPNEGDILYLVGTGKPFPGTRECVEPPHTRFKQSSQFPRRGTWVCVTDLKHLKEAMDKNFFKKVKDCWFATMNQDSAISLPGDPIGVTNRNLRDRLLFASEIIKSTVAKWEIPEDHRLQNVTMMQFVEADGDNFKIGDVWEYQGYPQAFRRYQPIALPYGKDLEYRIKLIEELSEKKQKLEEGVHIATINLEQATKANRNIPKFQAKLKEVTKKLVGVTLQLEGHRVAVQFLELTFKLKFMELVVVLEANPVWKEWLDNLSKYLFNEDRTNVNPKLLVLLEQVKALVNGFHMHLGCPDGPPKPKIKPKPVPVAAPPPERRDDSYVPPGARGRSGGWQQVGRERGHRGYNQDRGYRDRDRDYARDRREDRRDRYQPRSTADESSNWRR